LRYVYLPAFTTSLETETLMRLNHDSRRRNKRNAAFLVETLEGRALLSGLHGLAGHHVHGPLPAAAAIGMFGGHSQSPHHQFVISMVPDARKPKGPTGVVKKRPRFYEFYTGPQLAELNTTGASGKLSRDGSTFVFTGTVKGKINNSVGVYVWGIDRSGNLSTGPFQGRPNIKFDAVVVVTLDPSLTPSARVIDLTTFAMTNLPAGSASIHGRKVTVVVPASLLPSTGLAPSQYRFNFWPDYLGESGTASFAPESTDVPVGRSK
jgi:hypothetical protein